MLLLRLVPQWLSPLVSLRVRALQHQRPQDHDRMRQRGSGARFKSRVRHHGRE